MSPLFKKKRSEPLCWLLAVLTFLSFGVSGEELYWLGQQLLYISPDSGYGSRFSKNQSTSESVSYERFKRHIPEIHLPGNEQWESLNQLTWKTFYNNIQPSSKDAKTAAFVSSRVSAQFSKHEFFWDQAFISLGFGLYVHGAFNTLGGLDCFYNQQHEDGFIPREVSPDGREVRFFPGYTVKLSTSLPSELERGHNTVDFGLKESNWKKYVGLESEGDYKEFRDSVLKRKSDIIKRYGEENNSNPPLAAHAEWRHYLVSRDKDRLIAIYDVLQEHTRWLEKNRKIEGDNNEALVTGLFWQGGMGSGMDNLPVTFQFFDSNSRKVLEGDMWGVFVQAQASNPDNPKVSVKKLAMFDMSAQMKLHYDAMANISGLLDNEIQKEQYQKKADELKNKINQCLWNAEQGFYFNAYENCKSQSVDYVLSAYWGLYAKIADPEQARKMLGYLKNEKYFNTPMPFPALAKSSRMFCEDGDYWRGGVWPPLVYMTLKGLMNYAKSVPEAWTIAINASGKYLTGLAETMFESSGRTVDYKYKSDACWQNHDDSMDCHGEQPERKRIYEYNSPTTGERGRLKGSTGSEGLAKGNFVGWGGLGPIGVMQEVAVGLDVHENEIVWHLHRTDEHGIRNLYIGSQSLSFMVTERVPGQLSRDNITIEGVLPEESSIHRIRIIPKDKPSNEITISLKQQSE